MRYSACILVACLAFGSACAAVAQPPVEVVRRQAEADAKDDAIQRKLEETIVEVEFDHDTLEEALKHLRDKAGVNMTAQWGAIEASGIKRDCAVSEKLKGVSAAKALQVVLDSVSGDLERESKLIYEVVDGVVTVAPRKGFLVGTREARYDVLDLLTETENFKDAPTFNLFSALGATGAAAGSGIFFDDSVAVSEAYCEEKNSEILISRIREQIGTRVEWDDNYSIISYHRGQLLVKTTRRHHAELAAFLADLRRQKNLSIAFQARVLRLPTAEIEKLSDATRGTLALDAAQVKELMDRATRKDSGIQVLSSGRYRAMNGQRTYSVADSQQAFVAEVGPVKAGDATTKETKTVKETKDGGKETTETKETTTPQKADPAALPQATLSTVQAGFVFDIDAVASGDRRQVTGTLRSSLATVSGMRRLEPVGGIHPEAPTMATFQWRTTATIPSGGAVLLSASAPTEGGKPDGTETLLLLQATVVEPDAKK